MLLTSAPGSVHAQDGIPLSATLKKLSPEELEKTIETLSSEIPLSMLGDEHRPFAEDMIKLGRTARDHGEKIYKGEYQDTAQYLAEGARDEFVAEVKKRFPDENSALRQALAAVESDPETARKAAKAILDGDLAALNKVVQEKTSKELADAYDGLVDQGKGLLKDTVNDIVPGSSTFKKLGINPFDAYAKGVETFTEEVKSGFRQKHSKAFRCLHRRYAIAKERHGAEAASDEIRSFGLKGFDCVAAEKALLPDLADTPEERASTDPFRGAAQLYRDAREAARRLATETSTLTEFGTDLDEIADLIEEFDRGVSEGSIRRPQPGADFSDWVRKRFADRRPKRRPRPASRVPQSGWAKVKWDLGSALSFPAGIAQQKMDEAMRGITAILAAVTQILTEKFGPQKMSELTGLPTEDFLPEGEVKPFAEGLRDEKRAAERKKKDEKDPEKVARKAEKELECDPRLEPKSNGNLDAGFVGQETAAKGPDFVDEDGCRPYGPAPKRDEKPVKQTFEYEVPDKQDARKGQQKLASRGDTDKPVAAPAPRKAQPDTSRCRAFAARIDDAGVLYAGGDIRRSERVLSDVLSDLTALQGDTGCPEEQQRVAANLGKIDQMTSILDGVKAALTGCSPDELDQQANFLKGAGHIKLQAVRNRILRSAGVASDYAAAKSAYSSGQIDRSETLFRRALTNARAADGLTCENIENRIDNNLRRVASLQTLSGAVTKAVDSCDDAAVARLESELQGATNPMLTRLRGRLQDGRQACTVNPKCRQVRVQFEKEASMAAFALGKDGNCGAAWGRKTIKDARSSALASCRKRTSGCRIVAEHTHKPVDNTKLCRRKLANFGSMRSAAAIALSADRRHCGWGFNYKTRSAARKRALAECRARGTGCKIVRSR